MAPWLVAPRGPVCFFFLPHHSFEDTQYEFRFKLLMNAAATRLSLRRTFLEEPVKRGSATCGSWGGLLSRAVGPDFQGPSVYKLTLNLSRQTNNPVKNLSLFAEILYVRNPIRLWPTTKAPTQPCQTEFTGNFSTDYLVYQRKYLPDADLS
jgi:hypothetical protein